MPVLDPHDYWASVTDVPCPVCKKGTIRWCEAGYVPGSRRCEGCGRFFQAKGSLKTGITLVRDTRFDGWPVDTGTNDHQQAQARKEKPAL